MNFTLSGGSSAFQERVEGALRHHVNLVDDIDLEARRDRTITDPLDDLAGVIDAGMRGGVNLQNIDVSGGGDGLAGLADPARLQRRLTIAIGTDTVQPAGQKRAVEVLPPPRTPVSTKACASRPSESALPSVRTSASWPISSEKRSGRYLRASTR